MRYSGQFIVDLSLLSENLSKLNKLTNNREMIFMVKANAYGHGLLPITEFSYNELGIKEFGCASLGEAVSIRQEFTDHKSEIYVFSDIQIENSNYHEFYLQNRILPVVTDISELEIILSTKDLKFLPLCLKFDTGMGRIGLAVKDVEKIVEMLKKHDRLEVEHLMTHFSSSYFSVEKNKRTKVQYEEFLKVKNYFLASGIHLKKTSVSNSGAIEQKFGLDETHVRPGLMLFGPASYLNQNSKWDGKVISSLKSTVLSVREIKKGTPVGYGATPIASDGILAIIGLGYGDGIHTAYQGVRVKHGESKGQIVGRINMDMVQVVFGTSENVEIKKGDDFYFWQNDNDLINQMSAQMNTIPYQLFCQITDRVPRIYKK
jgi:alanine racemase